MNRFNLDGVDKYLDIREGDPVIFVQNHWDHCVQNGALGKLINIGCPKAVVEGGDVALADVEIDTGDIIPLTLDLIDAIRAAYAISLHKAQGSQFKQVIVVTNNHVG